MIQVSKGQLVTAQHENEQSNLIDQLNKRINKVGYDSVSQEYFEEKNQPAFTIKLVDFASTEDLTSQYVFFNSQTNINQLVNFNQQFLPFCLISEVPNKEGFKPEINFGNEIYSFAKSLSDSLSAQPEIVDASIIFLSADGQYYYTLANEDDIKNADAEIIQKFRIANLVLDEYKNDAIQQVHTGIITYSTETGQIIPDTQHSKLHNLGKYGQYSIENRLVTTEISDGLSVDTTIQQLHEFDNDDSFKKNAKQDDYFYGLSAKDVLVRLNKPCACSDTNGQMLSYLPLSDMMAVGDSQLSDINISSIYVCQDAVCQDRVEIYCFKDAFKDSVSSLGKRCFCTAVDSQLRPVLAYKCQEDSSGINTSYIPFTDYGIPNDKYGIENKGFTLPRNITSYANLTIGSPDSPSNPTIIFSHPSEPISVKNKLNKILYLRDDSSVGFADLSTSISGTGGGDVVSAGNYITINEAVTEDDQTVKVINGASINLVQSDYDCGQAQITYIYSKDNNQHNICYQPSFQNIHGVKACSGNREVNFCAPCGGLYIYGDDSGKLVNFIPQIYTTTPKYISVWQRGCTIMIDYLSSCGGGGGGDIGCYVISLNSLTGQLNITTKNACALNVNTNGKNIELSSHLGHTTIRGKQIFNYTVEGLALSNVYSNNECGFTLAEIQYKRTASPLEDVIQLSSKVLPNLQYALSTNLPEGFNCQTVFACNYGMIRYFGISTNSLCGTLKDYKTDNCFTDLTVQLDVSKYFPSSWVYTNQYGNTIIQQQLDNYRIEFQEYGPIKWDEGQQKVKPEGNTGGPIRLYIDQMPNTLVTQQQTGCWIGTCATNLAGVVCGSYGWQLGARGIFGSACGITSAVYWAGTDLVVDFSPVLRCVSQELTSTGVIQDTLCSVLSNYVQLSALSNCVWMQNDPHTDHASTEGITIGGTVLNEYKLKRLLCLINET